MSCKSESYTDSSVTSSNKCASGASGGHPPGWPASALGNNCEITAPPDAEAVLWRLEQYRLQALSRGIMSE